MRYVSGKEAVFIAGLVAVPAGVWHFSAGAALIVLGVLLIAGSVLWHLGERK